MDFQDFRETMPYYVEYYYQTNLVLVKNYDGSPIYEGLLSTDIDCKSAFRTFACPKPDCYREHAEYLQCYLYDVYKEPIFKKGGTSYYEKRMDKYLKRKEQLELFLLNVKSTKLSFMH